MHFNVQFSITWCNWDGARKVVSSRGPISYLGSSSLTVHAGLTTAGQGERRRWVRGYEAGEGACNCCACVCYLLLYWALVTVHCQPSYPFQGFQFKNTPRVKTRLRQIRECGLPPPPLRWGNPPVHVISHFNLIMLIWQESWPFADYLTYLGSPTSM